MLLGRYFHVAFVGRVFVVPLGPGYTKAFVHYIPMEHVMLGGQANITVCRERLYAKVGVGLPLARCLSLVRDDVLCDAVRPRSDHLAPHTGPLGLDGHIEILIGYVTRADDGARHHPCDQLARRRQSLDRTVYQIDGFDD
jgi:hypothetical protein